ncbi:MAG: chitobiase/beta-hexosaminidase C-terminal domain-containing protein [Leptospiraceae bacterium]|nr:chitobiase/beta-hexosaminidase C-terminal domain-containing protein [Leptospiraceae bacterium]
MGILFFFSSCFTSPTAPHKWLIPKEKEESIPLWVFALTGTNSSVTVSGTVTDSSGTAVAGANLSSQPEGVNATTDASGNYTFTASPGTYTITVTDSSGNVVGTFTLTVGTDGSTTVSNVSDGLFVTAGSSSGGTQTGTGTGTGTSTGTGAGTTTGTITGTGTTTVETVATPTFSPTPGTYNSDQSVTISSTTEGATIYYTTDGSEPTSSSTQYTSAISVSGNGTILTIKAIAGKSGMTTSSVESGTYTIESTVPTVSINSITNPYVSGNTGAINSKDITWSSNRNGTYSIRATGSDCSTGTELSSGNVTASQSNNITIQASSLSVGSNTIRFCVTDSLSGLSSSSTTTLNRDDTAPTVAATPGSTTSSTTVNITLICSDSSSGCDKIVYTSNGSDPTMSGTTGSITNGTEYTVQLSPPDGVATTYKYIARDNAGNVAAVSSSTYTIDTGVATVSVNSVSPATINNGTTNPQINWQSNKNGSYTVRVGGTDCTSGTQVASGTYSGTAITNTINATSLSSGANTIRICVLNLVGNYGSTTQGLTKDDVAPVAGNSGTITTANVTTSSLTLNWTVGSDTYTTQSSLQYKILRSTSNNISTVADAETNGTLVQDWTANLSTKSVTGLTAGTTYYFNVLVRDEHGNMGIYTSKSQATVAIPPPSNLSYINSPFTFGAGLAIDFTISPSVSGTIDSYSINPSIPLGLSFNLITGVISGTPTVTQNSSNYTITAHNGGGETTTTISIKVGNYGICYMWGCFKDNNNGTITYNGAGNIYGSKNYMWKKCSQGQVFRSGYNDCAGTGYEANNYGIGSYQYCGSNDNSCNSTDTWIAFTGSAFNTCNNDTFAGYTDWKFPDLVTLKTLINCKDKSMPNTYPTSPYSCGIDNTNSPNSFNTLFSYTHAYYWTSLANSTNYENAWMIDFRDGSNDNGRGKGYAGFVICVRSQ